MSIQTPAHSSLPTPFSEADASFAPFGDARLDKTSSSTLHSQLSDIMREKIYSRAWSSGKKIPSEHALMDMFGLSRGTVRHAIKSLVDEGLLVQYHGRGTFVAEGGISHPAGRGTISFAESLREQGKSFTTEVLNQVVLPAPVDIAYELDLEPGANMLFLRRVRSVEGEPIMCIESWVSIERCPGIENADFTREDGNAAVERCSGKRVGHVKVRYTARAAGTEHAGYLHCDESAPLLVLEQTISFEDRTPFDWSLSWLTAGQAIVGESTQHHR
ncbi:MAG: GntR family transcriptional regulator [Atopobiaceae bacterium]|nr:GntR family transcriptional regulator [Atopobiaceae bacterium]